jgi:hypothetical protein
MDHTLTKSVSNFISSQIVRDDYLIIEEAVAHNGEDTNCNRHTKPPFQAKLNRLQSLCHDNGYLSDEVFSQSCQRLIKHYEQSQTIPTSLEIVEFFLPHAIVHISKQHFGRQQDHAQLLKKVSVATQGCWHVDGTDSRQDGKDNCWVIAYKGQRKAQSYRFTQQGDWLDKRFLSWLIESAEYKSGYRVSCHDSEEHLRILCLPIAIHSLLIDHDAALFAA